MPPEKLGWDTTMRLCRQPVTKSPVFIHSYQEGVTLEDYGASPYGAHWGIEMPSRDDPKKRELYITVRTLSGIRAESMSGRATIVWAVMRAEDFVKKPPRKVGWVLNHLDML